MTGPNGRHRTEEQSETDGLAEFHRIRLDGARGPAHPAARYRYVFVAPLDEEGRIDARLWNEHRDECRVVRFRQNNEDIGHLVCTSGGDWAFHYDTNGTGRRVCGERFVAGELVSIEEDGQVQTFKVCSVERL
jgi:hypothetical protein